MLKISPHPKAPIFSLESNPQLVLDQLIDEISSPHLKTTDKVRDYLRQAGFTNLWFFAKYIAGYNGPFDQLDNFLHVEMANFFQSSMERKGKSAAFLGRGLYKSTIFTKAGLAWNVLRDPDSKWILFSAVHERSRDTFMHTIQRIYDANELFAWLYPEYVPEKNAPRWNDSEMVLPNRERNQSEPTILPRGVCCSVQGLHGNIYVDDPVGEEQLNAMRQSSADMYKVGNWLKSNLFTLLSGVKNPTVFYTATRYSVDDAHSFIFDDVKKLEGVWDEDDRSQYEIKPKGEWTVYNRYTMEEGESIAPEIQTTESLQKLAKEDPWTFSVQMQNKPRNSGSSELNMYELKKFKLIWDDECGWVINVMRTGGPDNILMSDCDTVQATDPGATEKYTSARTSRTAVGVLSRAPTDERFLSTCQAGFITPSKTFEWMFANGKKFYNYLRATWLETQGAFKILNPILREDIARRQKECLALGEKFYPIHHQSVTKVGGKIEVIRNTLEPLLKQGLLYVEESIYPLVWDELVSFPQSKKMDILDMICLASNNTFRPSTESEYEEKEKAEDRYANRVANAAGY